MIKPIRVLLENLSRDVVIKRKLPQQFGGLPLFVSPGAALKFWRTDLDSVDSDLLKIALEVVRCGHTVWDIGANVGLFSFASAALAGKSGKVLAVEPDPFLSGLLRRSAKLNQGEIGSFYVLAAGVSDFVGRGELNIARRSRSANFLKGIPESDQTGGVYKTQDISIVNLDWLMANHPAPNVLKIDIEGAEAKALSAAKALLTKARPVIVCEVFSENSAVVTDILRENKYNIYDAEVSLSKRVALERAVYNTIAYPSEMLK